MQRTYNVTLWLVNKLVVAEKQ